MSAEIDPAAPAARDEPTTRFHTQVGLALLVGLVASTGGVVDGAMMAAHRVAGQCADGTFFPQGATDTTCYRHPQGGLGLAVVAISLCLGCLVALGGLACQAIARSAPSAQG